MFSMYILLLISLLNCVVELFLIIFQFIYLVSFISVLNFTLFLMISFLNCSNFPLFLECLIIWCFPSLLDFLPLSYFSFKQIDVFPFHSFHSPLCRLCSTCVYSHNHVEWFLCLYGADIFFYVIWLTCLFLTIILQILGLIGFYPVWDPFPFSLAAVPCCIGLFLITCHILLDIISFDHIGHAFCDPKPRYNTRRVNVKCTVRCPLIILLN